MPSVLLSAISLSMDMFIFLFPSPGDFIFSNIREFTDIPKKNAEVVGALTEAATDGVGFLHKTRQPDANFSRKGCWQTFVR